MCSNCGSWLDFGSKGRSKPELVNLEPRTQDLAREWSQTNFVELWSVSRARLAEIAIEI